MKYNPEKLHQMLIDIFGEEYEVKYGEFRINCINPECDDDTGHLDINLKKGVYHCWKCGYSGKVLKLLKDYLGWVPEFEEYISVEELKNPLQEAEAKVIPKMASEILPKEFNTFNGNLTFVGQKAYKYILGRMTAEDVSKYSVGYCGLGKYKWRIIIPVTENGKVIYFVARTFMNEKPVYKNPTKEEYGIGSEEIVFNIDGARKQGQAVVCEGVFDAIRVGGDGVALLGTNLSEIQEIKLINKISRIYIMLDADAKDKAVNISRKLLRYGKDVRLVIIPNGDPADWPKDSLRKFIEEAKPFSFSEELKLKF